MEKPSPQTNEGNGPILTRVEAKAKQALHVLWNDLPAWRRDNHYIHSGYRPESNSYLKSVASLGHLHNESVNIYTHLIGALLVLVAGIVLHGSIRPRFEMATNRDVGVFACYFLGATTCLGMSATFHTICNHSEAVQKSGNKLDYIGIVFLIWGSFIPAIYYGFSAEPGLVTVYWGMVGFGHDMRGHRRAQADLLQITTIAVGTLTAIWQPDFKSPEWRTLRATVFVAMGLSAVVPVLHGVKLYGAAQLQKQMGLSWVVGQGVLYILGAAIYAVGARKQSPVDLTDLKTGTRPRAMESRILRYLGQLASDFSRLGRTGGCGASGGFA